MANVHPCVTIQIPLSSLVEEATLKSCGILTQEQSLLSAGTDRPKGAKPKIALKLVTKCLAFVHAFTAVGLEAQATGYSHDNGTIRYLAFLPQENYPHEVNDKPAPVNVAEEFYKLEPKKTGVFIPRGWIITRPREKPILSEEGYIQPLRKKLL